MKILFGVFDWGLGHATRDILLISELLKKGHKVHIISTGRALKVLKNEFKQKCKYFDVPSISKPYTKSRFFVLKFIYMVPKMYKDLKNARKKTKQIILKEKYDKVISDCRFDVYDRTDNSYLINHQLVLRAIPGGQKIMKEWMKSVIDKYKIIIVPDFPDKNKNLTEKLSHEIKHLNESKIKYIGIISQIKKRKLKKDIDYFISLSGPEPQRTILENKIIKKITKLKGKIVVAGGNPDEKKNKKIKNIEYHGFLNRKKQEEIMNRSKIIITRSGYTTIMELVEINAENILLIPTPGQTEQEYLSKVYEKNKYYHSVSQYKLNLKKDISVLKKYKGFKAPWNTKKTVENFIKIISI